MKTAYDWLSSVIQLELRMEDMDESAYVVEELRITSMLEQLPEDQKEKASLIYHFWVWAEGSEMPEA